MKKKLWFFISLTSYSILVFAVLELFQLIVYNLDRNLATCRNYIFDSYQYHIMVAAIFSFCVSTIKNIKSKLYLIALFFISMAVFYAIPLAIAVYNHDHCTAIFSPGKILYTSEYSILAYCVAGLSLCLNTVIRTTIALLVFGIHSKLLSAAKKYI